jgi:hypothetical protein
LADRFGDSEVNDLRLANAVLLGHEHVGRLQVAMDDSLLVRMLDRSAHLYEEVDALFDRQPAGVTVLGDRRAAHDLHREPGVSVLRRAGGKHLGDAGVIHERDGLALGLEPRDNLAAVQLRANHLDGNAPPNGAGFLGLVDGAHPTAAQQL